MKCNIDARGKLFRLFTGIAAIVVGSVVLALWRFGPLSDATSGWPMYAGIAMVLMGAFGVFEGWAGWCVVRAMGFKTRL